MKISEVAGSIHPSPTLSITARARAMRAEGKNIISLSSGELDLDPPDAVRQTAKNIIDSGNIKYTSASGMPELRQTIASKYSKKYDIPLSMNNVVVSAGAKHALANSLLCITEPGDEVIIPVPYWVSYPEMVKLAKAKPAFVETRPENSFKLQPEMFSQSITPQTRAMILNSPSNPTGAVYSPEEIEQIYKIARDNHIFIISDEIYENLILEGEFFSLLQLGDEVFENALIISGVSKTYAMTGWRIGWAIGNSDLISALGRIQSHQTSNPCTISQYAAISALKQCDNFVEKLPKIIRERRDFAIDFIRKISGFEVIVPKGAFYLFCDVRKAISGKFKNSMELSEYILETAEVATVPGEAFGMPGFIRISIADSIPNIAEALERISSALDNK